MDCIGGFDPDKTKKGRFALPMMSDGSAIPPVIGGGEMPLAEPAGKPWGFWATVGLSIVIVLGYVLAQTTAVGLYVGLTGGAHGLKNLEQDIKEVTANGKVLVLVTLCSAPLSIGLSILFAWLRNGITVREYLALRWPPGRVLLKWILLSLALLVVVDIGTSFVKGSATEEFMGKILESIGPWMPVLWIVLLVVAPISEEFLFRGFLFAGFAQSRPGPYGAIGLTALLFTAIHAQYDLQGQIFVLFLGLLLATARWKTGSLWLCVILHGMMNLIATVSFLVLKN